MAASTHSTAASYNPISGLITDNNAGAYGANGSGGNGGFNNPNAPTTPGAIPPATTPGDLTGVGAYTPDWAALINGDAGLQDAQAALAAGGAADQASLGAQIRSAYESFGKPVDLSVLAAKLGMNQADLQGYLGADAQRLAQENTDAGLSTTARIDEANKRATQALLANLNKRGMLHSGQSGYALDQQNTSYRQTQADAYDKFLGYLQQYQQGYTAAQNQRATALANAYNSAADRVQAGNQGSGGFTAHADHQDATGAWVYKGADGNYYNADKSPYHPPAAPDTPAPGAGPSRGGGTNWMN